MLDGPSGVDDIERSECFREVAAVAWQTRSAEDYAKRLARGHEGAFAFSIL
jgi:hypothetical protein